MFEEVGADSVDLQIQIIFSTGEVKGFETTGWVL